MKRLKLNLDQLGKELEMLDNEHLRGIKGGGDYGGYNSWEELWGAMQNGYVPPEGDYFPGGYGGYGDYGWGDYGSYGGYNGGWPGWYPPGGGYGGYGGYNGGGYGGYGGYYSSTPYDCFIRCFKAVHQQKFGNSTYYGSNNSYIHDAIQSHAVGVGGMPYPINQYGVPLDAAYNSLYSSFDNVSKVYALEDLSSSMVSENSVILALT